MILRRLVGSPPPAPPAVQVVRPGALAPILDFLGLDGSAPALRLDPAAFARTYAEQLAQTTAHPAGFDSAISGRPGQATSQQGDSARVVSGPRGSGLTAPGSIGPAAESSEPPVAAPTLILGGRPCRDLTTPDAARSAASFSESPVAESTAPTAGLSGAAALAPSAVSKAAGSTASVDRAANANRAANADRALAASYAAASQLLGPAAALALAASTAQLMITPRHEQVAARVARGSRGGHPIARSEVARLLETGGKPVPSSVVLCSGIQGRAGFDEMQLGARLLSPDLFPLRCFVVGHEARHLERRDMAGIAGLQQLQRAVPNLNLQPFFHSMEHDCDRAGAQFALAHGVEPETLLHQFARFFDSQPESITHPSDAQRLDELRAHLYSPKTL